MNSMQQSMNCTDSCGTLPNPAPLANPYVPFQMENAKTYQAGTGLIRGTIYPGLDLPFLNMVNTSELSKTLTHQLQALHFAISELGLYLDTHPTDQDAMELFEQYTEMYEDALQKSEENGRPTLQMHAVRDGRYRWIDGPWPWDFNANKEG